MAKQSKRRAPRAPFIMTVAATSAVALSALPGCGSSVNTGNEGCPEEMPLSGSACEAEGQDCSFGSDGCGNPMEMSCEGGQWTWTGGGTCNPPPPPVCPDTAPNSGDPCWEEGISCSYQVDTGCGPMDAPATCEGGVWNVSIVSCNPPPPDICFSMVTEADCTANAPFCRWLTPGCADPSAPPLPLGQAGCFPEFDCASTVECPAGTTCEERVYDPCYNLGCDACGATAMLCVAP